MLSQISLNGVRAHLATCLQQSTCDSYCNISLKYVYKWAPTSKLQCHTFNPVYCRNIVVSKILTDFSKVLRHL